MLRMTGITKRFSGVAALDGVYLDLRQGEVLGLIGENGAGKSTLMKILGGIYPHDTFEGQIVIGDVEQKFASTRDSEAAGVAIIHQELELVPQMTVAENIMLGHEVARGGVIDWEFANRHAVDALARVDLLIDPETPIYRLSLGQQQLVEIAKALIKDKRIIILDEPTTSLSDAEAQRLLALMRRLAEEGRSCIFVSHRLEELLKVSDRITVLRDGRNVSTVNTNDITTGQLISLMVGRTLDQLYPPRACTPVDTIFEVNDWTVMDPVRMGRTRLKSIRFSARRGEVLGFSGLVGAGRTELATSLIGAYGGHRVSGELRVAGVPARIQSPREAMQAGIAYVPEDRKALGLILSESIARNISLAAPEMISFGGVLDEDKEYRLAGDSITRLGIKCNSPDQAVGTLSGGNQQKVVLAKYLLTRPKVLILDEPTRGIDVGAKTEIYHVINQLAADGVCIIMISSDMPELLGMADRVIVMCEGAITADLSGAELTENNVMKYSVPSTSRVPSEEILH